MLKTQNYGFNKPELSDSPPDITVMNSNWDTIDKKIKENTDAIAQNREIIGTVKTEITKMDMSWDKISGKPNSFVPSAHSHTKSDIGLGSVQNYGVATQAQVDEGKANNLYVTPLSLAGLKQSVVNGKQTVVNAINDSLGYNSGLTINNNFEEYAKCIKDSSINSMLNLKLISSEDIRSSFPTQTQIQLNLIPALKLPTIKNYGTCHPYIVEIRDLNISRIDDLTEIIYFTNAGDIYAWGDGSTIINVDGKYDSPSVKLTQNYYNRLTLKLFPIYGREYLKFLICINHSQGTKISGKVNLYKIE